MFQGQVLTDVNLNMEPKPVKETVSEYIQSLERKGRIKIGAKSAIAKLCQELAVGVTLIAGNENEDKTTLSVTLSMHLVKSGARVLYVGRSGFEILDVISRYMSADAGHKRENSWLCRDRDVAQQTLTAFRDGVNSFKETEFYYASMDIHQSIESLESVIMNTGKETGWDYIFVDGLQDFFVESKYLEDKSQREYLCERLDSLSYVLMAPIIVTTHYDLSPEKYINNKGEVDLPEYLTGGQLPEIARRILFIHRPEIEEDGLDKNGQYKSRQRFVYVYFSGKNYSSTREYLLYKNWTTGRFWDYGSAVDPTESADFYHESIASIMQKVSDEDNCDLPF